MLGEEVKEALLLRSLNDRYEDLQQFSQPWESALRVWKALTLGDKFLEERATRLDELRRD